MMKLLAIITVGIVCIAGAQYREYTEDVDIITRHLTWESEMLSRQIESSHYLIKHAASDIERGLIDPRTQELNSEFVLSPESSALVRSRILFNAAGKQIGQSYKDPDLYSHAPTNDQFKQFSVEGKKDLWYTTHNPASGVNSYYYAKALYTQGFFSGVLVLELNTDILNYKCSNVLFDGSVNLVLSKSKKVVVGCGLDPKFLNKDGSNVLFDTPTVDGLHSTKHLIVAASRARVENELYAVSYYDTTLLYEKTVVRMFVGIIIYILSILSAVYVSNKSNQN